jgi:hypothetical protein
MQIDEQNSRRKAATTLEVLIEAAHLYGAAHQAFSPIVMGARKELVVVDTAPTGHTLFLLDTAGSYHRQVTQKTAVWSRAHPYAPHDAAGSGVHEDLDRCLA